MTAKRKETDKIYVNLYLSKEVLGLIDDQRRLEPKIPSRTEAIRRLIDIGLKHSKKPK